VENKKEKRKTLLPPLLGRFPAQTRSPTSPHARAPSPLGPISACSRARASPPYALPPSHWRSVPTRQPPPLSRAHSHWQCGPACQLFRRPPAVPSPQSPPAIASVLSSVFSPHREVWHRSVPPLDQRPRRYRPAVVSPRRRCAAFMGGLCSSPEPRSSTAPLPSRAYKRLAPSSFFPAPASAIPLLPRPGAIRGAPPSSPSPVSSPPSSLSLSVGPASD
jgi:hypothetical protein